MGLFRATRYVASLPLVSVEGLVRDGVRLVLLDRDNTCVPRDAAEPTAEVMAWLDRAREAGLKLCLVSNNFHSSQVRGSAEHMGVDVVDHAMKPLPFALVRAMRLMGSVPGETVMVGDRHHDVEAAAACGVPCVGVTYGGATPPGELGAAGACIVVDTVEELLRALLGHRAPAAPFTAPVE